MTKETLKRAKEIEEEIELISTMILPQLNDVYNEIVEYRNRGEKKLDVNFHFGRSIPTILTVKGAFNFIKTEIRTVTEHKERLEKELEEL